MKPGKNFRIVLIALLLAGVIAGFGYGMTATARTGEAQAAASALITSPAASSAGLS